VAPQTWKSQSQESYTAKETNALHTVMCYIVIYYQISEKNGIHSRIYRSQI